ncbi:MAG: hypothetical protein ACI8SE_000057 [Bacteroidia bacterium]|jgi:hypothetical protein
MNSRSLFKLVIYLINWLKISLIAFPVAAALITFKQGKMKYGYDFLTVDHNWSIIIAIGVGIVFNTWHAMEFETVGNVDPKQYLKMRQRLTITNSQWTTDQLQIKVEALMLKHPKRMSMLTKSNNLYKILVRNGYGFKDIVTLERKDDGVEITSVPKSRIAIVDMARNLKNTKEISKYLKEVG